jgi:membrane-bound serine protease (ClpP class)
LLQRVSDAKVPIGIWVGPSRSSRAYGLPAQLLAVADVTAMVGGSRIGYISDPLVVDGQPISFGAATNELVDGSMSFNEARAAGVLKLDTTDQGVPTVRNMVLAMDGTTIDGHELNTVVKQLNDKGEEQNVSTTPVFNGLGLFDEVFHTVASPPMAFLLFIIGIALLIFEFFTAGVGIAGGVGAVCALLGCYGLSALPTRPVAVAVLLLSMLAFAIDVQVGIPRTWTAVGIVLFIIGAWYLYRPVPGNDLRLGWITLIVAVGGVMLTFVVGMPSMVRTRFATPTIGREWMIGNGGTATTSIDPEGVAMVGGARWRARTNRATPIAAGAGLKVVAIDGVTLEVEPEEGGARDYRERRVKQ